MLQPELVRPAVTQKAGPPQTSFAPAAGVGRIRVRIFTAAGALQMWSARAANGARGLFAQGQGVVQRTSTLNVRLKLDIANEADLKITDMTITGESYPPASKILGKKEKGATDRAHETSWDLFKEEAAKRYRNQTVRQVAHLLGCQATVEAVENKYAEVLKKEAKKQIVYYDKSEDNLSGGTSIKFAKSTYLESKAKKAKGPTPSDHEKVKKEFMESLVVHPSMKLLGMKDEKKYGQRNKTVRSAARKKFRVAYDTDIETSESESESKPLIPPSSNNNNNNNNPGSSTLKPPPPPKLSASRLSDSGSTSGSSSDSGSDDFVKVTTTDKRKLSENSTRLPQQSEPKKLNLSSDSQQPPKPSPIIRVPPPQQPQQPPPKKIRSLSLNKNRSSAPSKPGPPFNFKGSDGNSSDS